MVIKLKAQDRTGIIFLEGRLDASAAAEAQEILLKTSERFDIMILDMAQLEYISSAGLRIIKLLHMTMRKKGGELVLRNVGKMVMEVFEMTGFVSLLRIE